MKRFATALMSLLVLIGIGLNAFLPKTIPVRFAEQPNAPVVLGSGCEDASRTQLGDPDANARADHFLVAITPKGQRRIQSFESVA